MSDNNFSATQFTQVLVLEGEVIPTVAPTVETCPPLLDDPNLPRDQRGDADDPAIYVHSKNPAQSLVLTVIKNAGLRVYDLAGNLVQEINPGDIRYNNIDLQYGFPLGYESVDIAVASDRNNDKLVIFKINPNATKGNYLEDITDSSIGTLFQADPFQPPYSASSRSTYGIALYRSPVTQDYYVFVNRRETGDVAQYRLLSTGAGTIGAERVRNFTVPIPAGAPADTDPQLEGMVVDQETGYLYIGQENVGIWKYQAEPGSSNTGILIDRVKKLGGTNLVDDVEGLTIYYGANGTGYLLASSQGDNTFAVYSRDGNNDFLGRFAVGPNGSIDSVQESDGADVINVPLGSNFPFGLFVTQDGSNDPAVLVEDDGELENVSTNFKFVPWQNIANTFSTPLQIDTTSYHPRTPTANSLLNGIASGDTTATSTVLWGRSNFTGDMVFELSTSASFADLLDRQTVTDSWQPVKLEITGLNPGSAYFYRVTDAAGATAIGRFKTTAEVGTHAGLRFGATGDWRGELAPYPGIANAADLNLDFFIALGDTIYADYPSGAVRNPDGSLKVQAQTLDEYRAKHAEVYGSRFGQNFWADLRASTSIIATIDDHEVTNDFQGGAPATSDPRFADTAPSRLINDTVLYENGLQAFQEYNPIRDDFYGNVGDPRMDGERKLYRYTTYGSDAASFVLDARSFRDPGLPGVSNLADPIQVGSFLTQSFDPTRTLLGRQQVEDLKADLLASEAAGITWKFVIVPEPMQNLGVLGASDRFEGYAAERTEILRFINDNRIDNVVFISADIHGTVVNNLTYQLGPGQAQIATNAFEITTGSLAFDAPFGPTVADLAAAAAGLLNPTQWALYDSLPITNDGDSLPNDKDDFIKQIVNDGLVSLGYDPIGLNNNLAIASGLINAKLLQGDYVALHTYSWTQFDIDADTQKLTVTTYGIPYYTEAELLANPGAITSLTPEVVSQFEVMPTLTANQAGAVGMGFGRSLLPSLNQDSFNTDILAAIGGSTPLQ
ncbi:phytase [Leptodesmis sp.]|uniref:phytase n=1 Tax=Leptodesmis sp. TaxID=3100501 RepID=UPI0040534E94